MRNDVEQREASGAAATGAAAGERAHLFSDDDRHLEATQAAQSEAQAKRRRRLSLIGAVFSVALFAASAFVLWRTMSQLDAGEVMNAFNSVTKRQTLLAILFTVLSYTLLTGYDFLALRQMRARVPYGTTALASFTSYAVSFTLGFPLVTAGAVRYRIYSVKGLRGTQVASLTVIAGITFWLGMGLVLAWSLVREAGAIALLAHTRISLNQIAGVAVFIAVIGYLAWVSLKPRVATIQGWRLELPGFKLTLGQMILGAGDVCCGAAVLFALLPHGHGINYETFLAIYVAACMLAIASHSPGGLGVFEATILIALSSLPSERVIGALLLFRLYYYLLPFVIALALLGIHEVRRRLRTSVATASP